MPVTTPRLCDEPSPQLMLTSRTALPFVVAAVTAMVNDAGSPSPGGLVGGVIASPGAELTLTITVPDAWPEEAGGVVVPPPPVAGGVVEPPCAPIAAVTVAFEEVRKIVVARPPRSVVTSP